MRLAEGSEAAIGDRRAKGEGRRAKGEGRRAKGAGIRSTPERSVPERVEWLGQA
ncbi:Uncharacterised protein [Burkholderia pseudomallei]|nr:Uncharacterised protein [Burkholderia pseudomallei]CAJ7689176.1 Uncharacterised protein [Burkholderia pseudomallei]CAJ8143541.1 Uncharacterised protein [Burkholderia pseudomallei]CAJ9310728.1 Uncharacterised protein [Burkholderia pseudomallei]CAJ9352564.1 Uncharacterised protein [Burkholderia pseudomallei]